MTVDGLCGTEGGGLQAERTALAWTRTSLAVIANGALLTVREFSYCGTALRLETSGIALGCVLLVLLAAARRKRILSLRPRPRCVTPRNQVHMAGFAVVVLIFIAAVAPLLRS